MCDSDLYIGKLTRHKTNHQLGFLNPRVISRSFLSYGTHSEFKFTDMKDLNDKRKMTSNILNSL